MGQFSLVELEKTRFSYLFQIEMSSHWQGYVLHSRLHYEHGAKESEVKDGHAHRRQVKLLSLQKYLWESETPVFL